MAGSRLVSQEVDVLGEGLEVPTDDQSVALALNQQAVACIGPHVDPRETAAPQTRRVAGYKQRENPAQRLAQTGTEKSEVVAATFDRRLTLVEPAPEFPRIHGATLCEALLRHNTSGRGQGRSRARLAGTECRGLRVGCGSRSHESE